MIYPAGDARENGANQIIALTAGNWERWYGRCGLSARAIGLDDRKILTRHILPNMLHSILVLATLDMAFVIIFEASLTFLGLGIQPPTPTWGFMLSEGRNYLSESPWMTLFPAMAVILTVVGINLLGDWLRDTFDPSLRNR